MLAVEVKVIGGRFVTSPRNRIVAPHLSAESAHPPHVHRAWPVAVARSFERLCTRDAERIIAEKQFLDRLGRFFTHPTIIHKVSASFRAKRSILDHHPALSVSGITRAISEMSRPPFSVLLEDARASPTIRVSMRKGLAHCVTSFQSSTRERTTTSF